MKLQFEYFYGNEAEDFTFYRIPKKIITSQHIKDMSYGAKMLYGLLFDRVGLSIMNSWFYEENHAYIIFSIQEVLELMYCSKPTAIKFMSELEDTGLIERQKRGRGLTDYIYVKKVVDKLLTRTFLKQNTVIQRLCLRELIPLKKPQAYYDTLKYINLIGDYRLNTMYHYADDPQLAWDKICDIQNVRDGAMDLIRDFV